MARRWISGDSARLMTVKYNETAGEVNELSQKQNLITQILDKLDDIIWNKILGSNKPSESAFKVISFELPKNTLETLAVIDTSLFGNYCIAGGSIQTDNENYDLIQTGINLSIKPEGVIVKCNSSDTIGKTAYILLMNIKQK